MNKNIYILLKKLYGYINIKNKKKVLTLIILMILTSVLEILSIGAVVPFITILTDPNIIFENEYINPLILKLGLNNPNQLILPLTLGFGVASLIAGCMRLLLFWLNTKLTFDVGAEISTAIYRKTLYQPYAIHVGRNSSEVINGISVKSNIVIYNILMPILNFISSIVIIVGIVAAIFVFNPYLALSVFLGFGLIYLIVVQTTKRKLIKNSQVVAQETTKVIKSLQEGLGGIRDVLLDNSQEIYCKKYITSDKQLRRAQASNLFISSSPRYAIEVIGILFVTILAYSLHQFSQNFSSTVPILAAFALGAQRLLPALQQVYNSWAMIKGNQESLSDTLDLLDQNIPKYLEQKINKQLKFTKSLELENINFRYNEYSKYILNKINIQITKGDKVGIIGITGSGKSTLIDIIMGLIEPTIGYMRVDGKDINRNNYKQWQINIAHVPQTIFLTDASIEENIAFGVPLNEINEQSIREAAEQAQLAETIEQWPHKYKTMVGERGVRLSGGQRQRIGIARALYKKANIIILDEATSALDNETEKNIMNAIDKLSKELTIIIISHRESTLNICTKIFKIENGDVRRVTQEINI
jgi:ATP-binding cassette subfamily B protein